MLGNVGKKLVYSWGNNNNKYKSRFFFQKGKSKRIWKWYFSHLDYLRRVSLSNLTYRACRIPTKNSQASSLIHRRQSWTSSYPGVWDVNPFIKRWVNFHHHCRKKRGAQLATFFPHFHLGLKLFGAFLNRIQTSLYLHFDESCVSCCNIWHPRKFVGFPVMLFSQSPELVQIKSGHLVAGLIPPMHCHGLPWMIIYTKNRAIYIGNIYQSRSVCFMVFSMVCSIFFFGSFWIHLVFL